MLSFDPRSLDAGTGAAHTNLPGVAEHAFAMPPFSSALALIAALDRPLAVAPHGSAAPVVVVGGVAAGIEITCAFRERILTAQRVPRVTIVDATAQEDLPLAGFATASRRLAHRALESRGNSLVAGAVARVRADAVLTDAIAHVELPSVATACVAGRRRSRGSRAVAWRAMHAATRVLHRRWRSMPASRSLAAAMHHPS